MIAFTVSEKINAKNNVMKNLNVHLNIPKKKKRKKDAPRYFFLNLSNFPLFFFFQLRCTVSSVRPPMSDMSLMNKQEEALISYEAERSKKKSKVKNKIPDHDISANREKRNHKHSE